VIYECEKIQGTGRTWADAGAAIARSEQKAFDAAGGVDGVSKIGRSLSDRSMLGHLEVMFRRRYSDPFSTPPAGARSA